MTTEPESTRPVAPATFKRTELQRFPSPTPGFEIVQTLVEIPEGLASGRHNHPGGPRSGTSSEATLRWSSTTGRPSRLVLATRS